jgi:hypothetical protein
MPSTLLVATRKGLFTFHHSAASGWQAGPPAFLAEPVTAVLRDPRDGAIYVALKLGHFGCKMHRSDDDGASWTELPAPAYPVQAENPAALDMIWTLAAGGADQPGLIWAGTLPGGLFVSRDRGESWNLIESLWNRPEREKWFGGGYDHPGIHSILVDPRDSNRLTIGISCGGIWKSDDCGESWRQAGQGLRSDYLPPELAHDPVSQDPHHLCACAGSPDTIWCQHHNGIFVSRDGGESFTEFHDVAPSVFGFPVAVHPSDPDTAWFAPARKDEYRVPVDGRFVVTRTRDGGGSFEILSSGLPDGLSWDLVYRHGLVVDADGRTLAMGSTTGNLWVSPDGGDGWTQIHAHLPPIAQVLFA